MFSLYTSLIIPTRNRSENLLNTIVQIKKSKIKFKEILVIDSSDPHIKIHILRICKKYSLTLLNSLPSTSLQRNLGLKKVNKRTKFVMFLDDDIIFLKNSFSEMDKAIQKYKKNPQICGFGFNYIDKKKTKETFLDKMKKKKFISFLNLYSDKPGVVTQSGWQTKILNLKKDQTVEWIYTAASIFKFKMIKKIRFDESFGSYSYLEDLDFSLKLKNKIFIPYKAKFKHPNSVERSGFNFGFIEVRNRYSIVKKNNLVKIYFFFGIFLRFITSLILFFCGKPKFLARALGNIYGVLCVFFTIEKS